MYSVERIRRRIARWPKMKRATIQVMTADLRVAKTAKIAVSFRWN